MCLRPLVLLELVVLVSRPVDERPQSRCCRPPVPVVQHLVFDLSERVLEQRTHHLLLVRRDVLDDLTVDANVSLPPLVKTYTTHTQTTSTTTQKDDREKQTAAHGRVSSPNQRQENVGRVVQSIVRSERGDARSTGPRAHAHTECSHAGVLRPSSLAHRCCVWSDRAHDRRTFRGVRGAGCVRIGEPQRRRVQSAHATQTRAHGAENAISNQRASTSSRPSASSSCLSRFACRALLLLLCAVLPSCCLRAVSDRLAQRSNERERRHTHTRQGSDGSDDSAGGEQRDRRRWRGDERREERQRNDSENARSAHDSSTRMSGARRGEAGPQRSERRCRPSCWEHEGDTRATTIGRSSATHTRSVTDQSGEQ